MPEGIGYGQGLDPFGQFLTQAYLAGAVPGSQTSAFNTVLDLISPGAIAGRQEAPSPIGQEAEQFENLFGVNLSRTGARLSPEQFQNLGEQQMGLQLSPQAQAEFQAKMAQAQAPSSAAALTALGRLTSEREGRAFEAPRRDAEIGKFEAEAGLAGARGEEALAGAGSARALAESRARDAQNQALTNNVRSLALWGVPVDAPEGTAPNPEAQRIATKFMMHEQIGQLLGPVLKAASEGQEDLAVGFLNIFAPGQFEAEDVNGLWKWLKGGANITETSQRQGPIPGGGPAASSGGTPIPEPTPRTPGGAGALAVPTPAPSNVNVPPPAPLELPDPLAENITLDQLAIMVEQANQGAPDFSQFKK
jgi:hypothetical protein